MCVLVEYDAERLDETHLPANGCCEASFHKRVLCKKNGELQVHCESKCIFHLLGQGYQIAGLFVAKLDIIPQHVDVQQFPDILAPVIACGR